MIPTLLDNVKVFTRGLEQENLCNAKAVSKKNKLTQTERTDQQLKFKLDRTPCIKRQITTKKEKTQETATLP